MAPFTHYFSNTIDHLEKSRQQQKRSRCCLAGSILQYYSILNHHMFTPNAAYEHCSAYEIVFALQESDNSAQASRDACQAFSTLTTLAAQGNDERYADFISAGAVEAIIGCLDSYGSDEVIALHACVALYGLTRHSAELTSFVVECGGIESMLQCIPFHIGDSLVCFYTTSALVGCLEQVTHVSRMWICPQVGSILDQLCYAGLNVRQKTSAAIAINISLLLIRMLESAYCEKKNNGCEDHDDDVMSSTLDSLHVHQYFTDTSTVNATRLSPNLQNESIHYLLDDTNFPSLMSEFVRIHYQDTLVVSRALEVLVTFGKLSFDGYDNGDTGTDNHQHNNRSSVHNGRDTFVSMDVKAISSERDHSESSHVPARDVMQLRQTFEAAAEPILKGDTHSSPTQSNILCTDPNPTSFLNTL